MGETTLGFLLLTALTVGCVHTAIGVDHTLPFIVLARAQGWSLRRLWVITGLCGVGHVLSSVLLGGLAIGLGLAAERMQWIESARASLASWLLIGFGLAYASWGLYRHLRHRPHAHVHVHDGGVVHAHTHGHRDEHLHPHAAGRGAVTAWTLFLILVFGPCEPLVPLLIVPAMQHHWLAAAAVTAVFAIATIGTMLAVVTVGALGLRLPQVRRLEAHAHTVAGLTVAASGAAILLLGI